MQFNICSPRFLPTLAVVGILCFHSSGALRADKSFELEKIILSNPETSSAYMVAVVKFIEQTVEQQPLVAGRYLAKIKQRLIGKGDFSQYQFLRLKTLFYQKKYTAALEEIESFLLSEPNPSWEIDAMHLKVRSNFGLKNFSQAISDFKRLRSKFGVMGRYEHLQRLVAVSSYNLGDFSSFKDGVDKLSAFFPYGVDAVWAFDKQFKVCHPKPADKRERLSLLKKLSWGADIYPGLSSFVRASLRQPMLDRGNYVELSEFDRLEKLYKMRLYALVVEESKSMLQKSSFEDTDRAKIRFIQGKALVRTKDAQRALMVFSRLKAEKPNFETKEVSTWLADSLRYLGLFEEAHKEYASLLARPRASKYIKWNYFWTAYRAGDYSKALGLLESSKVSFREGDRKAASLYWQAKTLEKMGKISESTNLYGKLIKKHANSFYVSIYNLQHPSRYREMELVAAEKANEDSFLSKQASIEAVAAPPLPGQVLKITKVKEHYKNGLVGAARQGLFELTEADYPKKDELQRLAAMIGHPSPKQSWMHELKLLPSQQPRDAYSNIAHKKAHSEEWKLYYPRAFESEMPKGLKENDKLLLWSIMRAESYYKPRARSHVGAMGLMQIMPYTGVRIAEDLKEKNFDRSSLERPEVALKYGSYYVQRLMTYFGNSFMALAGYNAGPENVRFWAESCNGCGVDEFIESIPFRETRKYVKKITKTYLTYRQIYDADKNIKETPEISLGSIRTGMQMY